MIHGVYVFLMYQTCKHPSYFDMEGHQRSMAGGSDAATEQVALLDFSYFYFESDF